MFHVTVYVNSAKEYIGFQTSGHAGYAPEGQDIVCAAASVLTINTINAIDLYAEDEFSVDSDQEEGMIAFYLSDSPSKEAELLLKTMILGLEQMVDDENYAEYIDLTFEEVQQP